jgi:hypothetical protein
MQWPEGNTMKILLVDLISGSSAQEIAAKTVPVDDCPFERCGLAFDLLTEGNEHPLKMSQTIGHIAGVLPKPQGLIETPHEKLHIASANLVDFEIKKLG